MKEYRKTRVEILKETDFVVALDKITEMFQFHQTDLSKAEAPSLSLIMSLVSSRVGPANVITKKNVRMVLIPLVYSKLL